MLATSRLEELGFKGFTHDEGYGDCLPEELCVGLPPHGGRGQHLVLKKQLPEGQEGFGHLDNSQSGPDFIGQRPIDASLSVEGWCVADGAPAEEVLDQVEMAAEAGVVERGGVPAVPDIQVYFLLLRQVAGEGGETEAGGDTGAGAG